MRRPAAVLLLWVLVLVATSPFVLVLRVGTSTDSVLGRHGADWSYRQQSIERFGGDEMLAVALSDGHHV
jgi:hypothetical protein